MSTSCLVQLAAIMCVLASPVTAITHETTLMWTEKETSNGVVNVKGIPGDPANWVNNGFSNYAISYFSDAYSRNKSHRVALAFDYNDQQLAFSDRGLKTIYRVELQVAPYKPYTYYLPLRLVYVGISTQVNGMAIDWASGSIYWTDALYNWITVANLTDTNVFNHIITTELLQPQGIAVYPQKGLLFWSDIGAVSKIEYSHLDGSKRANFLDVGVDKPLGLAIDYTNDRLYWVDDYRDTIEHVDIATGSNRVTIRLSALGIIGPKLFGLALYKDDYIFASDQNSLLILILNKTSEQYVEGINAAIFNNTSAIPYDVIMYDNSSQEIIDSDCARLACSDICVSDGGQRAHCICRTGYILNKTDNATCYPGPALAKPLYVYAMGSQLCSTQVQMADSAIDWAPSFIRCFYQLPPGHDAVGLGFHVYADLLFFSDDHDGAIHRMQMETDSGSSSLLQIAANTGSVKGLAVDWISDNLYWADEDLGYIMVSRLSGRYPKILIKDLYRPKAINVNPHKGIMYWVSGDTIYKANMDGTGVGVFLRLANSQFDGMVLDITRDRLYFVDSSLPGVRSVKQDGTQLWVTLQATNKTFHDVTVYETYLAWTTGGNAIFCSISTNSDSTMDGYLRGVIHLKEKSSHDIITYDEYLQPQLDQGRINPCDIDNDVFGCKQLCLLVPNGPQRRCSCSVGFKLAADLRSCVSESLFDNFLLFIDPFQKAMYQLDVTANDKAGPRQIHGIDLSTSTFPVVLGYDVMSHYLYWHDDGPIKSSIKNKLLGNVNGNENSLSIFSKDVDVGSMELLPTLRLLVFTDVLSGLLFTVDTTSPQSVPVQLAAAENVSGSCLAVNASSGDVYWVETSPTGAQAIYSCNAANCSDRQDVNIISTWVPPVVNTTIVGLTIGFGPGGESFVAFWTMNQVWRVASSTSSSSSSNYELLAQGSDSTNFTKVVVVNTIIYFVDWNNKSVLAINTVSNEIYPVTEAAFSRLTDLKVYYSGDISSVPVVLSDALFGPLSTPALIGIIVAGIVILLILLLVCILLLVLLARRRRRRRRSETTYKPPAHDNPTYMKHTDVVASTPTPSPGAGSPVDVSYATGGATCGVTFAFDFEKYPIDEKKIPPSFDDVTYDDVKDPDLQPYCGRLSSIEDEKSCVDFPPKYSSFSSRSSLAKSFGSLPKYDDQPSGLPF